MKNIFKYIGLSLLLLPAGCTGDFDEINTDPTAATADDFDANYLLSEAQYEYSNTGYSQLLFESMWIQAFASTYSYYSNGDKYSASSSLISYENRIFDEDYAAGSLIDKMMELSYDEDSDDQVNLYYVGMIMRALIIEQITDVYGDVPYSEAWQAETITQPVYDTQESIYTTILSELETAIEALDDTEDALTADLMYGGDIAQWKKFGYSLMLRVAMRLTKVDATTAQTYAEMAYAGGTFESTDDDALVYCDYSTSNGNGTSSALRVTADYREVRWSERFINYLDDTDDPRLGVVAEVAQDGLEANEDTDLDGDSDPTIQIGLPNGYDLESGSYDIRDYALYPGATGTGDDEAPLGAYSRPVTALYLDQSAPNFILSYGQVELLLAEAAVRGWNVGDAATHYQNGVTAAMTSIASFESTEGAISSSDISDFLTANPLDQSSTETALQGINEQYWIASSTLFNFIEAWNNWRRSGYPVLTPVTYTSQFTDGTIPRRVPYQSSEVTNNPVNYADAVSRLDDGDSFESRIWWDVE